MSLIKVEVITGAAVQRERVLESGEVKRYEIQSVWVHLPGSPYPREIPRNIVKGEKPLSPGWYTPDLEKAFANYAWGRIELSLRYLKPLDASEIPAASPQRGRAAA